MDETRRKWDGHLDVECARGELCERLPEALAPMAELIFNYRWAWMRDAARFFREIEPAVWEHSRCNPRIVVEATSPHRLSEVAADAACRDRLLAMVANLREELAAPPASLGIAAEHPVAYFCSEFAIHCSLPLYGGGLGVLAGDLLKASSDLRLPMVGVGLLYREGYFDQRLDSSGWQHEYWVPTQYDRLPAVRVTGPDGLPLLVEIELRQRPVRIQIWRVDVGRVPLFLLDTDVEANHPIDRWITARLYVGDRQTRLAQYAVLGIGGVRALAAMGVEPGVYHLNEGHAAFGAIERLRQSFASGGSFDRALEDIRRRTIFTTHTPVAAGNEGYAEGELEPLLGRFMEGAGVARQSFFDLGRIAPGGRSEPVSMTPLALRTSHMCNGVSRRHGEVARAMWQPLWQDRAAADVPIAHVTNGAHLTTWMGGAMQDLLDRHLRPDWRAHVADATTWEGIAAIPDEQLWKARSEQRRALIEYVRVKSIRDRLGRGEGPDYVEQAARIFEPDVLTIGFARRVATYKRLHLMTRFPERGLALLGRTDMPVQMVIAGKAHPQDEEAKSSLRDVFRIKQAPGVGGKVAFLENYDLHMAPKLVAGVDVWINLPRPPLEASGTSGMKVVFNGGLHLSVADGWWAEAYNGDNGWEIVSPSGDPHVQDDHDAAALMDLLETQVLPLFYHRDADGLPHGWLRRVKVSMQSLIPRFSAARMVAEYARRMYAPTALRD